MEKGPAAVVKEEPKEDAGPKIVNRRHGDGFSKHKSSTAMQTLLRADEATKKKEKAVKSGS